jgi:VanZ family protein
MDLQSGARCAMNLRYEELPRTFLHVVRLANAVLFWPVLAFVLWGELRPDVPRLLHGINDKALHFSAYFILGAMAGGAIRQRDWVKWAILGLIALGAVVEFIQAFVGRDPSLLDGITNGAGAIAGALLARFVLDSLRVRWGYDTDTPSA